MGPSDLRGVYGMSKVGKKVEVSNPCASHSGIYRNKVDMDPLPIYISRLLWLRHWLCGIADSSLESKIFSVLKRDGKYRTIRNGPADFRFGFLVPELS